MKISYYSSKKEVLREIGSRIKAARIDMAITQKQMADLTDLSQRTISNLENGADVSLVTLIEVLRVLGRLQALDVILPEVTLRPSQIVSGKKPRERASSQNVKHVAETVWKWGDEK